MDEAQRKRIDEGTRQQFETIREQGEGRAAILMEYPDAYYVRVSEVTTDDWGVTLTTTCIPAPGFGLLGHAQRESGQIACAWMAWSADVTQWRAQQIGWSLYFTPELVEAVVAEAARCDGEGRRLHAREAMDCVRAYRMKLSAEKPGAEFDF